MSDVTVKQLAEDVGIPVDRLLGQLTEAGLEKEGPDASISEDEKLSLLGYLRRSHGKQEAAEGSEPRKITLKRKTVSELRQPSAQGRAAGRAAPGARGAGKTVSVEVRRKRTYVKRPAVEEEEQQPIEPEEAIVEEAAQVQQEKPAEEKSAVEVEAEAKAKAEAEAREAAEVVRRQVEEDAKKAVSSVVNSLEEGSANERGKHRDRRIGDQSRRLRSE